MMKTQKISNAHGFDLSSTDVKSRMDLMEEVECYEKDLRVVLAQLHRCWQ
jgi:hypothetical protein